MPTVFDSPDTIEAKRSLSANAGPPSVEPDTAASSEPAGPLTCPVEERASAAAPSRRGRKPAARREAAAPDVDDSETKLRAGHRSRLRARFLADPVALPDHELLELLLGYVRVRHDNTILAKRLLQRFGSLNGVLAATEAERSLVPDCGAGVDTLCVLIREIIARSAQSTVQKKTKVSLLEIAASAAGRLRLNREEEVWAALLDKQNRLLTSIRIRHGSCDHVALEPRELVEAMLRYRADGMVLMHNHPSGSHRPSLADRDVTARIGTALMHMGMHLHDHLIITPEQCFSIKLDRCLELPAIDMGLCEQSRRVLPVSRKL